MNASSPGAGVGAAGMPGMVGAGAAGMTSGAAAGAGVTAERPPATSPPKATPGAPGVQCGAPAAAGCGDKSWSAVMAGAELLGQPPPYQSPQFQHEFPSLSADGSAAGPIAGPPRPDMQYGPGPSLRPQTEGSWMQGGSRTTCGPAQVILTNHWSPTSYSSSSYFSHAEILNSII